jgi:hypothetical protein
MGFSNHGIVVSANIIKLINKKVMEKDINTKLWDLFDLGKSYEFGYEPYSLDYQKAIGCYMQCVKLLEFVSDWHPTSVLLEKIGDFYYAGRGVDKNYEEALNWYSKRVCQKSVLAKIAIWLSDSYKLKSAVLGTFDTPSTWDPIAWRLNNDISRSLRHCRWNFSSPVTEKSYYCTRKNIVL